MNLHDATEQAYMNGYHKGKADAEESVAKEVAELETKCHQLEKERDALMEVARDYCDYCKHYKKGVKNAACANCLYDSKWEWRGVKDA